jgi:hypothetical protein
MSQPLITVGNTDLYTSTLLENDDVPLENDSVLLDDSWAGITHLWLNNPGLSIEHNCDHRSTASFVIQDMTSSLTFYERQLVHIRNLDNELRYIGTIQRCQEITLQGTTIKFHTIDSSDLSSILDWRVVDYAAEDKLAGDAVREILSEYLAEEGITEGYIEDGNLMTEIAIANKTAYEGLAKLADACGFVVYVDYNLKLYFHLRSLYSAEWDISDGGDILGDSLTIDRSNDMYRNTEIVLGGYEETDIQTETFITDGITKTFALGYPCNRVSTVEVNGSPQTVGVKGTDSGSYHCYYAVESETLTFDAAPASGNCTIEYYGLWKSKSKAEDLTAIAANKARQGVGSGKVEHITVDESLKSIVGAGEYANAKLSEYGVDGIQIRYKTRRPGLAAGVLQAFDHRGVDEDILICSVEEQIKDGDTEYTVQAVYGPVQEDWENFLNSQFELLYSVSEGVADATGVTKLYNFSHTFEAIDRPNPFTDAPVGDGIAVSSNTWPCFEADDRTLYIEFWRSGACVFRKLHTSTPDITEDDEFHSYSFISPSEAIGEIDEVVFWGGDSAAISYGSGVELFRANFSRSKSSLESYQVNATYINGGA